MARKKCLPTSEFPYHVSARCINKEWFKIPIENVWEIMETHLFFLHHNYDFRIHAFVLMSNHFHLLVSTPNGNISSGMAYFMRETARQIAHQSKRINQVYGGRHHKTIINNPLYYLHAYKYVYRNPVEAGIVDDVCAYPYSTLSGLLGLTKQIVPIYYDDTLFSDFTGTLNWLNTPPLKASRNEVRKALRKHRFKLAKQRGSNVDSILESKRY